MQALATLHRLPTAEIEQARVSESSVWSDPTWQFETITAGMHPNSCRLSWDFEVEAGHRFTDPEYTVLLESWRRAVWCLFAEPGDGKYRKFNNCGNLSFHIRYFVIWMVRTDRSDLSMVEADAADEYIDYLSSRKGLESESKVDLWDDDDLDGSDSVVVATLARYLQPLLIAYWARKTLALVGLPAPSDQHPLRGKTALLAARAMTTKMTQQTPEIPDSLFVPLMNDAFGEIEQQWIDEFIEFSNLLASDRPDDQLSMKARLAFEKDHWDAFIQRSSPEGRAVFLRSSYRTILNSVTSACGIVIQGTAGLRVSEMAGLPCIEVDKAVGVPNNIEIESTFDNEYEIFILRGFVYKHRPAPEPVGWVLGMRPSGSECIPPPVKAISIIARLYSGWRKFGNVDRLFVALNTRGIPYSATQLSPILSMDFNAAQKHWVLAHPELSQHEIARTISTQMWRKTFARYMIRTNQNLLPALSRHFKHMAISMTVKGYCQHDNESLELLRDARVQEAGELICGAITGELEVEGPVAGEIRGLASELKMRLGNRSAKAVAADVREVARERNFQLYDSGFGWCVFNGDGARCHELGERSRALFLRYAPSFGNQTPDICLHCKNFGVSPNHLMFWQERLLRATDALAKSESDPTSTMNHVLRRRVEKCRTVLAWYESGGDPRAATK